MNEVSIDTTGLDALAARLTAAGQALDKTVLGPALSRASAPLLEAVQSEAPVGAPGERISLRMRRYAPSSRNNYRRGGATRNDARLKTVDGRGDEVVRVLAGISKRSGKVGWRTHFITQGTSRQAANPFLDRALSRSMGAVRSRFMGEVTSVVNRKLQR